MTPADARAMYARLVAATGETVILRRINPAAPPTDVTVRARVTGYSPDELVGAIQQGDRKIIVLAEDIGGFPVPIREKFDKVVVRGDEIAIEAVDDSTRRIGGELIAYELRAHG